MPVALNNVLNSTHSFVRNFVLLNSNVIIVDITLVTALHIEDINIELW